MFWIIGETETNLDGWNIRARVQVFNTLALSYKPRFESGRGIRHSEWRHTQIREAEVLSLEIRPQHGVARASRYFLGTSGLDCDMFDLSGG